MNEEEIDDEEEIEITREMTLTEVAAAIKHNSNFTSEYFEKGMSAFSTAIENNVQKAIDIMTDPSPSNEMTDAQIKTNQKAVVWLARNGFGDKTIGSLHKLYAYRYNTKSQTKYYFEALKWRGQAQNLPKNTKIKRQRNNSKKGTGTNRIISRNHKIKNLIEETPPPAPESDPSEHSNN